MVKYSGNFGNFAVIYDALRPTYPKKLISLIFNNIEANQPSILDLGCGTGISTRQLAQVKSSIIGFDIDKKMLRTAKLKKKSNIKYVQGNANKLPFDTNSFDCVTAFTSFHWFMNKKAVYEIKRVLKSNGMLCIIQPIFASFQKDYRKILEKEIDCKIPKKYKISKEIVPFLNSYGFHTEKFLFKPMIKYNIREYIELLKSYSLWNFVPIKRRKEIEYLLKGHFSKKLINGYICNIKYIEVIIAKF